MQTRRDFIKTTAVAGAGLALFQGRAWSFGQTPTGLAKFIQVLPGLERNGIPVATPDTTRFPGADFYQIEVGQYQQQFHPDLPPSTLRGYADTAFGRLANIRPNHRYLGGAIVAQKGRPIWLKIRNNLPDGPHPLLVDTTILGVVNGQNDNRICTHLHGGFVPWTSDGGPHAWIDPHGNVGPSFVPGVNGTGTPGGDSALLNAKMRDLTLNADFDEYGQLVQRLGTRASSGTNKQGLPTWGRNYMDPATETPSTGSTEIWRIFTRCCGVHRAPPAVVARHSLNRGQRRHAAVVQFQYIPDVF